MVLLSEVSGGIMHDDMGTFRVDMTPAQRRPPRLSRHPAELPAPHRHVKRALEGPNHRIDCLLPH